MFNSELSPAQQNHLQEIMPGKVIDRTRLILDIFAMRAKTKEGRIQVELAQLEYLLPRLTGRGGEMSRLGGGIGTRGPGEKKLETDRRASRRRIGDLKREREQVRRHRALDLARRRKMEITQVALVGYTNAGKTTLLNQLTGAGGLAEDRLFATLDPTSRFLQLPSKEKILLTDTVGFIQDLPHELVAAFRSTLEQVTEADLLLHVVDASHPEADMQIEVVDKVLTDLVAGKIAMLTVLNKADLVHQGIWLPVWRDAISISAFSKKDLFRLMEAIDKKLYAEQIYGSVEFPVWRGELISTLYQTAEVLNTKVTDRTIQIDFRLPLRRFERLSPEVKALIRTR